MEFLKHLNGIITINEEKMKFPLMRNNILREDLDKVIEYLKDDNSILTQSTNVEQFEKEWSKWLGVKYSVFVNSGASTNFMSMAILKIKYPEGGEVIVPPLSWVSDITSVILNGFTPVFVDIDPHTLGMNNKQVLQKLNSKTRAVFITHVQGFDSFTDELLDILKEFDIPLIEDVCESHGATHNGQKLGSFGWMSNFSFYYAHHMSTIEGGMLCTNDEITYQYARMLRSHGMVRESTNLELKDYYKNDNPSLNPDFIFAFPSLNMRNTEIGGILGRNQLKRIDDNIDKRNNNLKRFLSQIDDTKYRIDFKLDGCSNYAFNLILKQPDDEFVQLLMNKMKEEGIEFRRGSSGGGNQIRQPYMRGIVPDKHYLDFPEIEHVHFYGFYLVNYPDMKFEEIDVLCNIINNVGKQ